MGDLITGLDIGGAHLKGAQVDRAGRVTAAAQLPCALWQGLDRLEAALAELRTRLRPGGAVAVTMTGELADLFADRAQGVAGCSTPWPRAWPGEPVWAGKRGFLDAAARAAGG